MTALGVLDCIDKVADGFSCVFDVFGIGWQSSLVKQAPLRALCASLPREGGRVEVGLRCAMLFCPRPFAGEGGA